MSILDSFTLHQRGKEPVTYKSETDRHRLSYEFSEFLALVENKQACHIVIPYVTRIMQEIAIAQERMTVFPPLNPTP